MKKYNTIITAVVATLIVVVALTAGTYVNDRMMEKVATKMASENMNNDAMAMKETYSLKFLSGVTYQPGAANNLEFTVVNKNGQRLNQSDYKVEHEKRMHVIVVSNDLTRFQHVHPIFDTSTNSFKLQGFVFPSDGQYRIYTDFTVGSHETKGGHGGVEYQDVIVGDPSTVPVAMLGEPTTSAVVDGNKIDLAIKPGESGHKQELTFTISRDGKKVTDLQKYLGALGHLVVIREGDLEYIHTHTEMSDITKQNGNVHFNVDFTQPGTYKAFAQFQRDGKVMTASYTIVVK